jgi:glycogen operon protein
MARTAARRYPGSPYPLGAHYDGSGTNFSLFSEVAERVELCLFSRRGREERIPLEEVSGFCWHVYLPGVGPKQRYGYRVYGKHRPERGHRCNPKKLLLDPYAKAISGAVDWDESLYSYKFTRPDGPINRMNSVRRAPRSVVINPYFDWENDRAPRTPWHETIIHELHVKGFTATHPDVPAELRGTYAGLAHPAAIAYLKDLGVTAVELMPVHEFLHDQHLIDRGLRNYWGYNTIGYFAPHHEYASWGRDGEQVNEFKHMVKALHAAGIEVILDVVYNHTAEGNHLGPTLCFRGIDNAAYYRLTPEDPTYYLDFTGCGNSLNMRHPHVLQLIMDSLRYWVLEMHVDGFRFDLAAALARELYDVDRLSTFLDMIQQDPVISQIKLIAEPWDVGPGGYQVGNFPPLWSEWNGKYRDTVRDLWRGHDQTLGEFAARFTGSSDLYANTGREPYASVNFVTAHDGFPLRDLVSYDHKHNEANLEDNADGEDHNRSWNCGHEGPIDNPAINALRARQQRNFLATLLLSQGVPMLLAGDEIGRSQGGNNNAYCQDNAISWIDWSTPDRELLEFCRELIRLRREHPVFRRRGWFVGRAIRNTALSDIGWFRPDGGEMTDEDWSVAYARALAVFLNGRGIAKRGPAGEPIVDDDFYAIFNAHHEPLDFALPPILARGVWQLELDTAQSSHAVGPIATTTVRAEGRSVILLRRSHEDFG